MKMFKWQYEFYFQNAKRYNVNPAGRRTGKTDGGARGGTTMICQGLNGLWVDVVYKNIKRYFDAYFKPRLEESNIPYHWDKTDKILTVYADSELNHEIGRLVFGSADRPDTLEGFAYDFIIINEAGLVIKQKPDIFKESIFPMMLENKNSKCFAIGTPKGQYTKEGNDKNDYYKMYLKAQEGHKDYQCMQLASNVNPIVDDEQFKSLLEEYGGEQTKLARQEVFGEFIEFGGDCLYPELNWYDIEIKPEYVEYKIGFIDFAGSGKDYLCFCIAYLIGSNWYIVDVYHTQDDTLITLPNCILKAREHALNELVIETNGGGAIFYNEILNRMLDDDTIVTPMRVKGNKETRIIEQKINVMSLFNFRRMKTHSEMYDKFLLHILSYETGVKNQVDDAPDAVSSLSKYVFSKFNYLYR